MRRYESRTTLGGILLLGLTLPLGAQFLPEEIILRPLQEKWLRTAEVVKSEDVGEGVTRPKRIYLKCPEGEISGCWKNPTGVRHGYLEGWRYEIAAYRMDKLLDLNMIPPTVERAHDGKPGSIQFWVDSRCSLLDVMEDSLEIPNSMLDHHQKMKYIIRAFDSLIGNEDRTQQNIRYTEDWRIILIDHSRSFRSSPEFTERLMYGKNGIRGEKRIRRLPRVFVEKLRDLDFDKIRSAVGEYLEKKEIKALLRRNELLLEEIDSMIRENGESAVIYGIDQSDFLMISCDSR